jgi:hypothetical protein
MVGLPARIRRMRADLPGGIRQAAPQLLSSRSPSADRAGVYSGQTAYERERLQHGPE